MKGNEQTNRKWQKSASPDSRRKSKRLPSGRKPRLSDPGVNLLLLSCVTSGRPLNVSELQLPHPQNEDADTVCLTMETR